MTKKTKRAALIALALAAMIGIKAHGAEPELNITQLSGDAAVPGSKSVHYDFLVRNDADADFDFTSAALVFTNSKELTIQQLQPISGTVKPGGTITLAFQMDIGKQASTGSRAFQIAFSHSDGSETVYDEYFLMFIMDDSSSDVLNPDVPPSARTYHPALDFSHTTGVASGFSPGKSNTVTFQVHNRGDTPIRNAEFIIELPEGMSVFNASTASYVGTISIGQRVGRSFNVMVYDDLEGGRAYPVTLKVTGTDKASDAVNLERTFYIPVTGTGSGAVRDVVIENVSLPSEAAVDEDFAMTFSVRNSGSGSVRNIKAYVEMPEGIINKSNATFVIDSMSPGESQLFSVTMSATAGSSRSYPIKIAVEPLNGDPSDVIKYASIYAKSGGEVAKTPQLMVEQYSYGGSSVMAGKEFFLNVGFFNTSGKELSNIKVTISSDDGTFVPVDSSNSFFMDNVPGGGHFSKTLVLRAKPSAEQKTTAITVMMSYEDGDGGAFTAEDTISIPVMQAMRLSVDEIVPPYECYVGSPGSSTLQFYNMGKTTLNNLMVNAEGDFDIMESNSYYVGNMEGGNSDSYTFVFIPREVGPMEGKIVFTYEDLDGEQVAYEVPFLFQVMEMPVYEDMYPWEPEQKHTPWTLIIFGIVLVLAVAGIIIWRKVRKTRLNKKLEIQDAYFNAALDADKKGAGE
ncbi:MAG: NEW3 domain-containing protein [Clostridiales bacterium]|nr:NEW3 domain-containing protein [Clostridiales bacterium]